MGIFGDIFFLIGCIVIIYCAVQFVIFMRDNWKHFVKVYRWFFPKKKPEQYIEAESWWVGNEVDRQDIRPDGSVGPQPNGESAQVRSYPHTPSERYRGPHGNSHGMFRG